MSGVELARSRARLIAAHCEAGAERTAARRIKEELAATLYDPDQEVFVRAHADPELQHRLCLTAAAILNSNDIAASVSARDRAALSDLIDPVTREAALRHRTLARPKTGQTGASCAEVVKSTMTELDEAWSSLSPFGVKPDETPPNLAQLGLAMDAAIRVEAC